MKWPRNERSGFGRLLHAIRKPIRALFPVEIPSLMRRIGGGAILSGTGGKESPIQLLPLKHLRLWELADAGFNYPDFRFFLRGELKRSEKLRELHEFFDEDGRLSCRTFTEENVLAQTPKLAVAYGKSDWNFVEGFCCKNNERYHTLVNKSLPLDESLLTGNIILLGDSYYISCFEGSGTPHDVDDMIADLMVCKCQLSDDPPDWVPEALRDLVMRLQSFRPEFRPMTVEFSLYPYPVGMLGHPEILWEWRGGSAHDISTAFTCLLEKAKKLQITLSLPAAV